MLTKRTCYSNCGGISKHLDANFACLTVLFSVVMVPVPKPDPHPFLMRVQRGLFVLGCFPKMAADVEFLRAQVASQ